MCASPGSGEYCQADRPRHPVNCQQDAARSCQGVKRRLPTEAEWEYAARGMGKAEDPWRDSPPGSQLCWSGVPTLWHGGPWRDLPSEELSKDAAWHVQRQRGSRAGVGCRNGVPPVRISNREKRDRHPNGRRMTVPSLHPSFLDAASSM
ncbi:MAG: SUMF1/EgtB/PvdO family nonheme iron enzyme [Myxococcales bacterium]|nr:formylglycine-generating enzyme family protein [Myxococcota bacterium]MDW8283226.1 SUMF1/EgtB/PvdO family nonheme iron enzyme [Myxococcales bacterium]